MLDSPGLYMIRCRTTGQYYIGSTSRSFRLRFSEHRTQLRRGVCSIPALQAIATQYGLDDLDFVPLKVLAQHELVQREKEAIATLKPALNIDGHRTRGRYERWDKIAVGGEEISIPDAARKYGLEPNTIRTRLRRGLSGDDLIALPHKAPRKPNQGWYSRKR